MPTTPQNEAGWRIDPPVSDPSAQIALPAATAAALPPELPPGTQSAFQGLCVGWNAEFSVEPPIANSSIFALPRITGRSACNFSITVALYGGTKFSSILDAQVVLTPFVQILSLIAPGIPSKYEIASPAAIFLSAFSASCSAVSRVTSIYA